MIAVLAEKVVEVIESSKSIIEKAAFVPNNSSFPEDTNVKEGKNDLIAFRARISIQPNKLLKNVWKTSYFFCCYIF